MLLWYHKLTLVIVRKKLCLIKATLIYCLLWPFSRVEIYTMLHLIYTVFSKERIRYKNNPQTNFDI